MARLNQKKINKILKFIKSKLKNYEEIEKIYIEEKNKNAFEVLVITKTISPKVEKEVIIMENTIKNKYEIPVQLKAMPNFCFAN